MISMSLPPKQSVGDFPTAHVRYVIPIRQPRILRIRRRFNGQPGSESTYGCGEGETPPSLGAPSTGPAGRSDAEPRRSALARVGDWDRAQAAGSRRGDEILIFAPAKSCPSSAALPRRSKPTTLIWASLALICASAALCCSSNSFTPTPMKMGRPTMTPTSRIRDAHS